MRHFVSWKRTEFTVDRWWSPVAVATAVQRLQRRPAAFLSNTGRGPLKTQTIFSSSTGCGCWFIHEQDSRTNRKCVWFWFDSRVCWKSLQELCEDRRERNQPDVCRGHTVRANGRVDTGARIVRKEDLQSNYCCISHLQKVKWRHERLKRPKLNFQGRKLRFPKVKKYTKWKLQQI